MILKSKNANGHQQKFVNGILGQKNFGRRASGAQGFDFWGCLPSRLRLTGWMYGKDKTLNANFLIDFLCVCFTTAYTGEKSKKPKKKQANIVLPVSAKVGLGKNCPMLNVYDVVSRVRRINRSN